MDLSGIIFVVLALAWAVYLIPRAVKHHDEVARNRSVDRFSTAMRVLARREPVDRGSARLVVTPPRGQERVLLPSRPAPRPAAGRAAARAAARRRRRVLGTLLVADLVVATLAGFAVLPWWGLPVPVALTVAYLVLIRTQVRRGEDATWTPSEVRSSSDLAEATPRRAIRVEAPYGTLQAPRTVEAEFSPDEETVAIPIEALETVAVAVETVDGGSLWDPLPVTLPTYVGKARADRTVRTIDLSAPGTWSSGRDEADSALVEQASASESEAPAESPERRAVGT